MKNTKHVPYHQPGNDRKWLPRLSTTRFLLYNWPDVDLAASSALILNGCHGSPWYWATQPLKQAFAIAAQTGKRNTKLCSCLNKSCCIGEGPPMGHPPLPSTTLSNYVRLSKGRGPKTGVPQCQTVWQFVTMSPHSNCEFQGIPHTALLLTKSTNHPNVAGCVVLCNVCALHVRIHSLKQSRGCHATAGWLWI